MPESKPSAMQQIIEALSRTKQEMESGSLTRALLYLEAALSAARAMQEQQAGDTLEDNVRYLLDNCPFTVSDKSGERTGQRGVEDLTGSLAITFLKMQNMLAASPSAPPVAGGESASAAPEGLAAHAIEELCQLGYTVRDSQLVPPDNLHELARVAGWASPSGERARPVAGDSVQQPVAWLRPGSVEPISDVRKRALPNLYEHHTIPLAPIQQAAQPEAMPSTVSKTGLKKRADAVVADVLLLADHYAHERVRNLGWQDEARKALANGIRAKLTTFAKTMPAPSNPESQQAAKPVAADESTSAAPDQLRRGVRAITGFLRDGEWADLLTTDPDLAALEEQVRKLVEGRHEGL